MNDGEYYAILHESGRPEGCVVSDRIWVYLWEEGRSAGIKYKIGGVAGLTGEVESSAITSNETAAIDLSIVNIANVATEAECKKDVINESLFTPPSNVKFRVVKAHVADESEIKGE